MKNSRWTVPAAAFCVLALSAYGCASDPAIDEEEEEGTGSSSGKPKADAGKSDAGKTSSSGGSSGRSSSSGGNNTSSGGVDTDAGDDDDGGTSSSSGGVTDGGGATDGGAGGCTVITAADWALTNGTNPSAYTGTFTPVPAGTQLGFVNLGFYNATGPVVPAVASYDLGTTVNSEYLTCEQCVLAQAGDDEAPTITFFQASGTVQVTAAAPRTLNAKLTNVKLVEVVEVAPNDYNTVANGACIIIENATVAVPAVP